MEKINLKALLDNYVAVLCNRTFKYTVRNKTRKIDEIIILRFYKENLCHLLGLQHVYGESSKTHLGAEGFKLIDSGNLTVKSLQQHNKKGYNFIKLRLSHFNEIHDILMHGKLVAFDKTSCFPRSDVRAEFMLYREGIAYILHLFLSHEYDNLYVPVSFIVQSQNDDYPHKYIKNQLPKKIIYIEEISNDQYANP